MIKCQWIPDILTKLRLQIYPSVHNNIVITTIKMKDDKTVIREFNEVVNMTAPELEKWLKSSQSGEAGWSKDDGSGETVGHDSGRKITEILKSNPDKKADKYTEDQIQHMRKVVAYCKRHLAQEKSSLENKSTAEAKKTKSYISLKNWGHDPLKGEGKGQKQDDGDDEEEEEEVGEKRKKPSGDQNGASKKRETRKGEGKKDDEEEKDEDEEEVDDESEDYEEPETPDDDGEDKKSSGKKAPKPGETVSWNWGQGQPEGKVLDVKEGE